jgi:hypothetical protein
MKNLFLQAIVASSLTLLGCGSTDTTTTSTTGSEGPASSELNGTWETACSMQPGQQFYGKTRLVYKNLALSGTFSDFADAKCSMQMGETTWTGKATVGGPAAVAGATDLDLAFDTYHYKPLSEQAAMTNNQYMYCGISDWAANVERDVLGKPCNGFVIPPDGKSLDIYKIDGTTLLLGKGSKISATPSESDRPSQLDDARVFTKSGS